MSKPASRPNYVAGRSRLRRKRRSMRLRSAQEARPVIRFRKSSNEWCLSLETFKQLDFAKACKYVGLSATERPARRQRGRRRGAMSGSIRPRSAAGTSSDEAPRRSPPLSSLPARHQRATVPDESQG